MYEIYQKLCNLIQMIYSKDANLEKYKRFYIAKGKISKSKHGMYNAQSHYITIYNLYRDNSAIMATTIHELSHHIDYIQRRTTDHSQYFYNIYFELLKAGLDMNLFSKDEIMKCDSDASDFNKIKKMLSKYYPKQITKNSDTKKIRVYNSYKFREQLKEKNYKYDSLSYSWTKTISSEELETEENFLKGIEVKYKIVDENNIEFVAKVKLFVNNSCFEVKEQLKAMGFKFDFKSKRWFKVLENPKDARMIQNRFPRIKFSIK